MVVLSSVASPRGSTLSVDLSCLDAVCQGFAELVQHSVVAVRRGTDTVHQDRSIDLGSGSFRLLANHRGATGIHLNARGKRTLKAAEKHPVELSLVVSYSGQTVRRTIRVS